MIRHRTAALLLLASLAAACGQKGDLYLPQDREAVATVPASAINPPAGQDEDDTQSVRPPATGNSPATPPAGNTGNTPDAR